MDKQDIKDLRTELGMTQEEFATSLGYKKQIIYQIESGLAPITSRMEKAIALKYKWQEDDGQLIDKFITKFSLSYKETQVLLTLLNQPKATRENILSGLALINPLLKL